MDFYKLIYDRMNPEEMQKLSVKLNKLEGDESYRNYPQSTAFVHELMKDAGLEQIQYYALPSDGKTAYGDCIMPQAWNRTGHCFLKLDDGTVLCDTDENPFSANIWSAPCKECSCEIVDGEKVNMDAPDVKGKLVFFNRYLFRDRYRKLAEAGALGFIACDDNPAARRFPDAVRWNNGMGFAGWYHAKGDVRTLCFMVPPKRSDLLMERLASGRVFARALMNTEIFDGEIYSLTGILPGKRKEEIAIVAHMYEPFIGDDSAGVIAAVKLCQAIRELVDSGKIKPLEYTIRVVFSMERYGTGEFFLNPANYKKIRWCFNFDSIAHIYDGVMMLRRSPDSLPFAADYVVRKLAHEHIHNREVQEHFGSFSDDTYMSDVGIPTSWLIPTAKETEALHHNFGRDFFEADSEQGRRVSAINGAAFLEMTQGSRRKFGSFCVKESLAEYKQQIAEILHAELSPHVKQFRIKFFCNVRIDGLKRLAKIRRGLVNVKPAAEKLKGMRDAALKKLTVPKYYDLTPVQCRAANLIFTRVDPVLPSSILRAPQQERVPSPGKWIDWTLSFCDGRTSLYQAILSAEASAGEVWTDARWKEIHDYFFYLEKYHYLSSRKVHHSTVTEFRAALKKLGIRKNDTLIVHASFASLGDFEGGAPAVCHCLMEEISKDGTLMMPTFDFLDLSATDGIYDPEKTPSRCGAVSEYFRKMEGVYRSLEPSHPVAVWGRNAKMIAEHHHQVPTMGKDSPMGILEQQNGKILLMGCPHAVSFMHVVETSNHVPCLGVRTNEYQVRLPDGRLVPCRTWSWRTPRCRFDRHLEPIFDRMRKAGTLREVLFHEGHLISFDAKDFRRAHEYFLKRLCKDCPSRPCQGEASVVSDWDAEKECIIPGKAFTEHVELSPGKVK